METDRSHICGCKGIRSCLKCEHLFGITPKYQPHVEKVDSSYIYCNSCDKCWPGWSSVDHNNHSGEPINVKGIYLQEDFLSIVEEEKLINDLNSLKWDLSQSGRRKQNFGPKCNFKKRKLRLGDFQGFPECTKFVQDKFRNVSILENFHTIEQCTLEYDPKRGASIDPHIDDCWVWGERIVTVNLMADATLTLTSYRGEKNRYNLCSAPEKFQDVCNQTKELIIRIPMPRRSLLVLHDEVRYSWLHQVYREDIISKRICLAYREFTPAFLPGGKNANEGEKILETAARFWKIQRPEITL